MRKALLLLKNTQTDITSRLRTISRVSVILIMILINSINHQNCNYILQKNKSKYKYKELKIG